MSTADVEKIARELALIEWNGRHTLDTCHPDGAERMRRMARAVLDQARAPLVEAAEALLDCVDYTKGYCQVNEMVGATLPKEVIVRLRATLTGIGEKEAFAGKTGNNKEKKETSANAR